MWLGADSFGVLQINFDVLKGRLWPLRPDVLPADIEGWVAEWHREGMLFLWEQEGKRYGYLTGWPRAQRIRNEIKRVLPEPPAAELSTYCPHIQPGGASPRSAHQSSPVTDHFQVRHTPAQGDLFINRPNQLPTGYEGERIRKALKSLEAKVQADPSGILRAYINGFGSDVPGMEYIASEFLRLVDKICKAHSLKNPVAYALVAVETFHKERVNMKVA